MLALLGALLPAKSEPVPAVIKVPRRRPRLPHAPRNAEQRELANKIDEKAREMAEANQEWDTAIIWDHLIDTAKIRYTRFDQTFCERYLDWRTDNPV